MLEAFAHSEMVNSLGWVFLHFIWQGALVFVLLRLSLLWLRNAGAATRDRIAFAALLLLLAFPAATLLKGSLPASEFEAVTVLPTMQIDREPGIDQITVPRTQTIQSISETTAGTIQLAGMGERVVRRIRALLPFVVLAWMAGVLIMTCKSIGAMIFIRRLLRGGSAQLSGKWEGVLRRVGAILTLPPKLRVIETGKVSEPIVIGVFRPVILLPARGLADLSDAEADQVFIHELAHVLRRDGIQNLFLILAEILFFFHPAVWLITGCSRSEREHCCDEFAVREGKDPRAFAKALMDLEQVRPRRHPFILARSGGSLKDRIERILSMRERTSFGVPRLLTPALLVASVLLLVSCAYLSKSPRGQDPLFETWEEYRASVQAALDSGDDALAMELSVHSPKTDAMIRSHREWLRLTWALDDTMHRRYDECFNPPANIEDLITLTSWERASRSFSFSLRGYRSDGKGGIYGATDGEDDDRYYLRIRNNSSEFLIRTDCDLDGQAEFEYDGSEIKYGEELSTVIDRAPDGRRCQVLMSQPGIDPRERAQIMFYRDGDFFLIVLDTDGDGKADCGRSYHRYQRVGDYRDK